MNYRGSITKNISDQILTGNSKLLRGIDNEENQ